MNGSFLIISTIFSTSAQENAGLPAETAIFLTIQNCNISHNTNCVYTYNTVLTRVKTRLVTIYGNCRSFAAQRTLHAAFFLRQLQPCGICHAPINTLHGNTLERFKKVSQENRSADAPQSCRTPDRQGLPILQSHTPVLRKDSVSGGKLHEHIGRFARQKTWAENTVVCTAPIRFDCLTLGIPGWIGKWPKGQYNYE